MRWFSSEMFVSFDTSLVQESFFDFCESLFIKDQYSGFVSAREQSQRPTGFATDHA